MMMILKYLNEHKLKEIDMLIDIIIAFVDIDTVFLLRICH